MFTMMDGYKAYIAAERPVFQEIRGRFLVRGGQHRGQGGQRRSRNVVIEFKDYETALACYHSPEYQAHIEAPAAAFVGRSHHHRRL